MPRFVHSLVIERSTDGARDDYGNPTQTWATVATESGLVQQKRADEIAQLSQAGPVASQHRAFLHYGTAVREADRIAQDGRTFQVTGVDPDVGGAQHHAVADLSLVTSAA